MKETLKLLGVKHDGVCLMEELPVVTQTLARVRMCSSMC